MVESLNPALLTPSSLRVTMSRALLYTSLWLSRRSIKCKARNDGTLSCNTCSTAYTGELDAAQGYHEVSSKSNPLNVGILIVEPHDTALILE